MRAGNGRLEMQKLSPGTYSHNDTLPRFALGSFGFDDLNDFPQPAGQRDNTAWQIPAIDIEPDHVRQPADQQSDLWLQSLGKFLKHELANKIAAIRSSHELLKQQVADNPECGKYLARAEQSLSDVNSLLNSVAEANSLEAALSDEQHCRIDLGELVRDSLEDYGLMHAEQDFELHCEKNTVVHGCPYQLRLLLDKLINNAVEHCAVDTAIEVTVQARGNWAQLRIKNYGDPLPPDSAHLFDLFVSSRTDQSEHFGLGLHVAKLIAESHDGKIFATPVHVPTGAEFSVLLPLRAD